MNIRACCTGALLCVSTPAAVTLAQDATSLADLRWSERETATGRFVVVPGERAFVGGYSTPGLEIWTYPLQLVRGYWVSLRIEGDTTEIDGRRVLRDIQQTPTTVTRVYVMNGLTVRERIFTPRDLPAATIYYTVESSRPVTITVHFTPSLNLMWPGAIGGQEIHWDSPHSSYALDEPSHRFRAAILSPNAVDHEQPLNNAREAEFERPMTLTLRATPGADKPVQIIFAGSSAAGDIPLAIAESLATNARQDENRASDRYARLRLIDITTPDTAVNRAIRWAQITLEQAWVCNPQLGCGLVAGYGPSRGARRPQYAWFFAGDGLVAVDALLREGAYARARDELEFIMRRQNKRTGAIWHELSQSAGFLDWEGSYPYMFVHVDVSFDFLDTIRDYVETTGDVAFAARHWASIRAAFEYCRATVPGGRALPEIPAGHEGRDEQDPQRDELTLSLAWVTASASFAELARLTGHVALADQATTASRRARDAVRPAYYDARRGSWASGHLRSGVPVEGLTSSAIALLHQGLLSEREQQSLVAELVSSAYRAPWGIRSTPNNSPFYDPDSYARGSVWALGTADAIRAFYEANRADVGTTLWRDLVPWFALDAPGHMHEVLRGDTFAPERESVPDQTWSSASFISSTVRGLLGIRLDGAKRTIRFAPHLPAEWDSLHVRRVDLGGSVVALALRSSPGFVDLEIENSGPAMTLTFQPTLRSGARIGNVEVSGGASVVSRDSTEVTIRCPAKQASHVRLRLSS